MKSTEIKPGDLFIQDGLPVYTVLEVETIDGDGVYATVRYVVDGGRDVRSWDIAQDVPLTPSTKEAR